mgnify:CR=1 FL=1
MKTRTAVVTAILVWSCGAFAAPGSVRDAALRVYIHGMTAEIADREVGRGGVRELLELLDEQEASISYEKKTTSKHQQPSEHKDSNERAAQPVHSLWPPCHGHRNSRITRRLRTS